MRVRPSTAFLVATIGLALAALLDANALLRTAQNQPFGWRRDVAVAIAEPLAELSSWLRVSGPRHWVEDALGRESTRPLEPPPPTSTTTVPPTTSTSGGSTTTTAPPRHRVPTPADPLRVLIVGDSMIEALAPELQSRLESTGRVTVTAELHYSSGLTRPDFFDWPARAAELCASVDPELVIVMMGANDAQGIATAVGAVPFGSEAWNREYRARADSFVAAVGGPPRELWWIGLPAMRSSSFDARMRTVTALHREAVAARPATRFIDSRAVLAGPDGGYAAYLDTPGGPVLARRDDGIHMTPAGAEILADVVVAEIAATWSIGAAP